MASSPRKGFSLLRVSFPSCHTQREPAKKMLLRFEKETLECLRYASQVTAVYRLKEFLESRLFFSSRAISSHLS